MTMALTDDTSVSDTTTAMTLPTAPPNSAVADAAPTSTMGAPRASGDSA